VLNGGIIVNKEKDKMIFVNVSDYKLPDICFETQAVLSEFEVGTLCELNFEIFMHLQKQIGSRLFEKCARRIWKDQLHCQN